MGCQSLQKREVFNQTLDDGHRFSGDLGKLQSDAIEMRIDIPLTPDALGLEGDLIVPFDHIRKHHPQFKSLPLFNGIFARQHDSSGGDVHQLPDELVRISVENAEIIDEMTPFYRSFIDHFPCPCNLAIDMQRCSLQMISKTASH